MYKRGQVTVFVIVGILILALVGGYFFLRSDYVLEELKSESVGINTASIKLHVEDCLKDTAEEGIYLLAKQGGYYGVTNIFSQYPVYSVPEYFEIHSLSSSDLLNLDTADNIGDPVVNQELLSEDYIYNFDVKITSSGFKNLFRDFPKYSVPYYFYLGNLSTPDKEVLEKELADYLEEHIVYCVDLFAFNSFNLTVSEPTVETVINYDNINIDLKYPLEVIQEGKEAKLDKFKVSISSQFGRAYDIVSGFVEQQNGTPNRMLLGTLTELSHSEDFNYTTLSVDNDVLYVFSFKQDDNTILDYTFMVGYDWDLNKDELDEGESLIEVTSEVVTEDLNAENINSEMILRSKLSSTIVFSKSESTEQDIYDYYGNNPPEQDPFEKVLDQLTSSPEEISAEDLKSLNSFESLLVIQNLNFEALGNADVNTFLLEQLRKDNRNSVITKINSDPSMISQFMKMNKLNIDFGIGAKLGSVNFGEDDALLGITTKGNVPTTITRRLLNHVIQAGVGITETVVNSDGTINIKGLGIERYGGEGLMVDKDRLLQNTQDGTVGGVYLIFDGRDKGFLDLNKEDMSKNLFIRFQGADESGRENEVRLYSGSGKENLNIFTSENKFTLDFVGGQVSATAENGLDNYLFLGAAGDESVFKTTIVGRNIKIFSDHFIFSPGSSLDINGGKSVQFQSEAEYYFARGNIDHCSESEISCISDYIVETTPEGETKVNPPDDHSIPRTINAHMRFGTATIDLPEDYKLGNLYVGESEAYSQLLVRREGSNLQLYFNGKGKDPIQLKGNPLEIDFYVEKEFYSFEDDEVHRYTLQKGDSVVVVSRCSDCGPHGKLTEQNTGNINEQLEGLMEEGRLAEARRKLFNNPTMRTVSRVDAPLKSGEGDRSRDKYNDVIDQFKVNTDHPERYKRTKKLPVTRCNVFAYDVMDAMGITLPRVLDRATGDFVNSDTLRSNRQWVNVNRMNAWIEEHGTNYGWRKITVDVPEGTSDRDKQIQIETLAQKEANNGMPTLAVWMNPVGIHGHIAVVRPGGAVDVNRGPIIAQAGGSNFQYGRASSGFGRSRLNQINYWVHD